MGGLGPELGIHWAKEMSVLYDQQIESQVLDRTLLNLGFLIGDKAKGERFSGLHCLPASFTNLEARTQHPARKEILF